MRNKDFLQLVTDRYSCRSFSDMAVSREVILEVIEAARLAPSACNKQPWAFIVIDDLAEREVVIECYNREWIKSAQAFIVACGRNSEAWHRGADNKDHTDIDVSIAIEHICLAATAAGLGSCWVCNFDMKRLREGLNIPEELTPIAIIPLGYPAKDVTTPVKNRKTIEDIVKWGKF